ncbi:MAG TPA: hypothetical protein VF593_12945 [Chthoniobacteraceae bacterium]|jgi:hypothetical protein
MKLLRIIPVLFAAAFLAGSSFAQPARAVAESESLKFLRTTTLPDETRGLQTVSTEYRPANGAGPSVWLVGVAHLGTKEYYAAIQQRLDRQSVVLYEGIGLQDLKAGPEAAKEHSAGIQGKLATGLGLLFQLEAIDYRRAHFINSDLHVPELREEVEKRSPNTAEPPADETFNNLLSALQGTGAAAGALGQMIGFLTASPEMQETTKLMLVEVLGRAGEFLAAAKMQSAEIRQLFDVLLTQRNEIVLRDLRAHLKRLKPEQSIAVFYGAAHMDEIAKTLRSEMGYAPVKEEWDTAFSASPAKSGIQPAQLHLMLDLMRTHLQAP